MKVPLLDLKAQYETIQQDIEKSVIEVLRSQKWVLGEYVKNFEDNCAKYCGVNYAIGVSSGSDALLMALMAIDLAPDEEVITTPYSFFATAGSIARMKAKAVFVDIDKDTYNIDASKIEEKITSKTRAIMPVHLYGQCAQMDQINEIAKKHNLVVIEDAAQAFGSEYKSKKAGNLGDIGCFSFYPSKNLGGIGDGGLITVNSKELYDKLVRLRNHGSSTTYYHDIVGGNFRLDALQATALNVKLNSLAKWNEGRRENANYYENLVQKLGLTDDVKLPVTDSDCYHIYNQFVIRIKKRDELKKFLHDHGIGCAIYYPLSLHKQPCFSDWNCQNDDLPESSQASLETLALPVFPELSDKQKDYVVNTIKDFLQKD